MQMTLEEAIGYVAADELIEASIVFLILQIKNPINNSAFDSIVMNGTNGHEHFLIIEESRLLILVRY